MKILHAADLHIDSPLRGLAKYDGAPVEELRLATRTATENLVRYAIDAEVDLVVIAGDVFDGDWKDYGTGLFWLGQLAELRDHDIPVVLVSGNHDAASDVSRRLTLPDNVTQLASARPERKLFDELGVAVVGQSYSTKSVSDDLVAAFPLGDKGLFTIGLLHTSLDGRPGHASYAPTSIDMMRGRGYQYWALGHVHQREVVLKDPWIVFPGNLQGRHARETGSKGASLISVADNEVVSVEHVPLDVARWVNCSVDVSAAYTLDDVVTATGTALDQAANASEGRVLATRVTLTGATDVHRVLWSDMARTEAEVRALGVMRSDLWIEKVKVDTRSKGEIESDLLTGMIGRVQAIRSDPAAFAEISQLFADLRNKVPAELRVDDGGVTNEVVLGSDAQIGASLDAAVELLQALLIEGGAQ